MSLEVWKNKCKKNKEKKGTEHKEQRKERHPYNDSCRYRWDLLKMTLFLFQERTPFFFRGGSVQSSLSQLIPPPGDVVPCLGHFEVREKPSLLQREEAILNFTNYFYPQALPALKIMCYSLALTIKIAHGSLIFAIFNLVMTLFRSPLGIYDYSN